MKIKVLTEVDAPKGATHYWGDLLDEPKFAKTSREPDGWTYWWWYDPTRQDWFLSEQGPAGTKPHWIKELPTHHAADLREMLRAMQAGEMTVSRGLELLDMWLAGNYSDDQLPPVSEVLPEDKMPWDVIREQRTLIAEQNRLNRERQEWALHTNEIIRGLKEAGREAVTALEPFAEGPELTHLDNAPCHNGITTREKCGRCERGLAAFRAKEKLEGLL